MGAALWLAMACGGCTAVRVAEPLTVKHGGDAPAAQMAFWHDLTDRPVACNDEAFHALLLYADGRDAAGGYDARVAALRGRGMLPAGFNEPADRAVTRGTLAVAIVRLLQIRGGWALTLLGPTPRYATRELVYRGIYPRSSPQQTLTGNDLVGIIGKIEDVQESQKGGAGAGEAGGSGGQSPADLGVTR